MALSSTVISSAYCLKDILGDLVKLPRPGGVFLRNAEFGEGGRGVFFRRCPYGTA